MKRVALTSDPSVLPCSSSSIPPVFSENSYFGGNLKAKDIATSPTAGREKTKKKVHLMPIANPARPYKKTKERERGATRPTMESRMSSGEKTVCSCAESLQPKHGGVKSYEDGKLNQPHFGEREEGPTQTSYDVCSQGATLERARAQTRLRRSSSALVRDRKKRWNYRLMSRA